MSELYNGMLENTPSDPRMAENYAELLALLKEQREISERGIRQSPEDFWKWDRRVQSLLGPRELAFLLEPHITNADPKDPDIARVNRLNHLIKILVYRQGIQTTNGFNG